MRRKTRHSFFPTAYPDEQSSQRNAARRGNSTPGSSPATVCSDQYVPDTLGATVLLYDDILKELSDLFEKDLIILPSSIHEVLILATDENDRQNLDHYTAMVKEVNASQLQDEEILSDHAYYYCRHSHLLTMPQPVCTS